MQTPPTHRGKVLVLHGPNLNLLGMRQPHIYGSTTLQNINDELINLGKQHGVIINCFQSNSESELITHTQDSIEHNYDFLIINPAAYTHTSIAWRDAVAAANTPLIEVHLSNIFARESFRHKSYFSDIAVAVITGMGKYGYYYALTYAISQLKN